MKKALISTTETNIKYISSWTDNTPTFSTYPNSCRVAEVGDTTFEVYKTLFWIDCADDVVQDQFYYDTETQTIKPIVNMPEPEVVQPNTTGTQTS
jgi:hypothetical protein